MFLIYTLQEFFRYNTDKCRENEHCEICTPKRKTIYETNVNIIN